MKIIKALQYSSIGSFHSCQNLARQWAGDGKVAMIARLDGCHKVSQWTKEGICIAFAKDPEKIEQQGYMNEQFGVKQVPDPLDFGEVEIWLGPKTWLDLDHYPVRVCTEVKDGFEFEEYENSIEAIMSV